MLTLEKLFFADEIRYVEYNAESPAGMAYTDVLAEVFDIARAGQHDRAGAYLGDGGHGVQVVRRIRADR